MMRSFRSVCLSVCALALLAVALAPRAATAKEARLLRYPSIHKDFVVFVYAGDLWRAPSTGGHAFRLTSHEGVELFDRILALIVGVDLQNLDRLVGEDDGAVAPGFLGSPVEQDCP